MWGKLWIVQKRVSRLPHLPDVHGPPSPVGFGIYGFWVASGSCESAAYSAASSSLQFCPVTVQQAVFRAFCTLSGPKPQAALSGLSL